MTSSNKTNVPEAKSAMNRFKMEVASELGVPLTDGYNGNLTSAQNGSVGGYMVKNISPEQHCEFFRNLRCVDENKLRVTYSYSLAI